MLFLPNSHHLTTFSVSQFGHRVCWQLGHVWVFMLIGVSTTALFAAISFDTPRRWQEPEGPYAGPDENCFVLLFEGGCSKKYSSANRAERSDNPSN